MKPAVTCGREGHISPSRDQNHLGAGGQSWKVNNGQTTILSRHHILKPVLPTPNWITSFDRRPVFQQMPVSPIFGVLCKLFWSIVQIVVKYVGGEVSVNLSGHEQQIYFWEQECLYCNMQTYKMFEWEKREKWMWACNRLSLLWFLEKLREKSRGMTRDPDKIKNYDRALLDNAPTNFHKWIR